MGNLVEVKVPDIGDFKDVEVIEVLVKAGDAVAREQSLITVESDKASMEIPSSHAGRVKAMRVKLGDKVSEGSVILELEAAESGAAANPPQPPSAKGGSEPRQVASPPFEKGGPGGIPPAPRPTGEALQVTVPDIGDFKDVEVIEVLVRPGDRVNKDQSLITVESDKASMEIPSPAAGLVQSLLVKIGDKVSQGSPIVMLAANEAAAALPSPAPAAPVSAPPAATTSPPSTAYAVDMVARPAAVEPRQPEGAMPHASPSVRKFARELGVDLTQVAGSGPKGRITQDDVREHVKRALAGGARPAAAPVAGAAAGGLNVIPWPQVDFAKFGPVERVEMSRIKKLSGPNLARNWVMIPHVTNHEDADITELEAFRVQLNKENEKSGVKVTMLAFLIKACVAALKKFPDFNSSIAPEGDAIIRKNYWHVGFAADTPNGLVVPVIRDADRKGIFEIAQETAALAAKARDGKLAIGDMQGGTFSISSLGGIGGTYFTPIINAPEVAILGVCRSTTRPVWDGKQFVPRLILPLSLSWDHRVVDGASAARFNAYLASLLADFRRVLL
ncbi:MAG: acetyltransferase component of pyruvate dehydrogenase complex [Betaproteobacteria bacterium]|nr:MAG: acetyltransferase component of pyruvate dehydrogenase complex [Betaproteobacteria bacterium]